MGGYPGVPLTQPMRGGGGGDPVGDPLRVRGHLCALWLHTMMCCDSAGGIDEVCIN